MCHWLCKGSSTFKKGEKNKKGKLSKVKFQKSACFTLQKSHCSANQTKGLTAVSSLKWAAHYGQRKEGNEGEHGEPIPWHSERQKEVAKKEKILWGLSKIDGTSQPPSGSLSCAGASKRGCGRPLWGEAGAGPAGQCRFRPAPTDPPQGRAEPQSWDGGTSGTACVRNGKNMTQGARMEAEKRGSNSPASSTEEEEGRRCSSHPSQDSPEPAEKAAREQVFLTGTEARGGSTGKHILFLKDCSPRRTPSWSRWRAWGSKEQQRRAVMGWTQPPFPHPLCRSGQGRGTRVGNEGVKSTLGRRGRTAGCFGFVFASQHPTLF